MAVIKGNKRKTVVIPEVYDVDEDYEIDHNGSIVNGKPKYDEIRLPGGHSVEFTGRNKLKEIHRNGTGREIDPNDIDETTGKPRVISLDDDEDETDGFKV